MMFCEKAGELVLTEAMKKKFILVKKLRGHVITSISNSAVKLATQIFTGKVMWKCCFDEVLVPVVALAAQCTEGVQFNWAHYLCGEFLPNFCKA